MSTSAIASQSAGAGEPSRSLASTSTASGSSVKTRWLIVVLGVTSKSTSITRPSSGTRRAGTIGPDGRTATAAIASTASEAIMPTVRHTPSGTDGARPWPVATIQPGSERLPS